jgi:hypothetical protein
MGTKRRRGRSPRPRSERPIPLAPVDLLAGLAPGILLHADDLPPGVASGGEASTPATTTVAETGKLVRSGDRTVRRLIRTPVLAVEGGVDASRAADTERAGVLPRTRDKPGE